MSNTLADYAQVALLKHLFKITALTVPTHVVIALSTADPLHDGSGLAEPVANGYSRVNCDTWTDSGGANPASVSNTAQINFPTATGPGWGTITHVAIFDNGGNLLAQGAMTGGGQAVPAGIAPFIAATALVIGLQ